MRTIERPKAPELVSSSRFSAVDKQIMLAGLELLGHEDMLTPEHRAMGFNVGRMGLNNEEVKKLLDVFRSGNLPGHFTQRELWTLSCGVLDLTTKHIVDVVLNQRETTTEETLYRNLADNLGARIAILMGYDNENTREILARTSRFPFFVKHAPQRFVA